MKIPEGLDPEVSYQDEILEDEVALGGTPAIVLPTRRCEPLRVCLFILDHDTRNDAIRVSGRYARQDIFSI